MIEKEILKEYLSKKNELINKHKKELNELESEFANKVLPACDVSIGDTIELANTRVMHNGDRVYKVTNIVVNDGVYVLYGLKRLKSGEWSRKEFYICLYPCDTTVDKIDIAHIDFISHTKSTTTINKDM